MVRKLSQYLSKRLNLLRFIGDDGIKEWVDKNIVCLQKEQLVMKKKLTSEQSDLVKEEMVKALVEEILEHAAHLQVEDNKYTITLYMVKRDWW